MDQIFHDDERRQQPRVQASFIVIYKVNKPLEVSIRINKREIPAIMLDLSIGGMALITEYSIPSQSVLFMAFTLMNIDAISDDEKIRTMDMVGEVRYCLPMPGKEHRLGIQFTRISEEDKVAIARFVETAKDSLPRKM